MVNYVSYLNRRLIGCSNIRIPLSDAERIGIMEKHIFGPEYGFATRAVHTGNDIDQDSGAIKRPITMANSYAPRPPLSGSK